MSDAFHDATSYPPLFASFKMPPPRKETERDNIAINKYEGPSFIGDVNMPDELYHPDYDVTYDNLNEYLTVLKTYELVDDAYILSDNRDIDGTISIFVKLTPLSRLSKYQIQSYNKVLTRFLANAKIRGADAIEVNFQYKNVYVATRNKDAE